MSWSGPEKLFSPPRACVAPFWQAGVFANRLEKSRVKTPWKRASSFFRFLSCLIFIGL